MLVLYIIALLISFYLLAHVSDKHFIPALDEISKELKLSDDMAGATLMAIGSSAPELFVALISVLKPGDHIEIGMGTIVGSAIFNILIIIGAVSLVRKSHINWQPVLRDTIFYVLSIVFLLIVLINGTITLWESILFLSLYLIYVYSVVNWKRIFPYKEEEISHIEEEAEQEIHWWNKLFKPINKIVDWLFPSLKHYYVVFFVSIAIIGILCWVLVESAIHISVILNVPEVFIALIVLAAGTSVPDMMSSVIVAKQGRGGMAISNAVGSNIFDILVGLGLPWLLVLPFSQNSIAGSTEYLIGSIFLLLGSVLAVFILLMVYKWKTNPRAGYILIGLYIIFLLWEIFKLV